MEYAFTDAVVRQDRETLTEAALTYLGSYGGAFEPLVAAKRAVDQGEELNVAQIRTVLNAMRADTSVVFRYVTPEPSNVLDFTSRRRRQFDEEPTKRNRQEPRWRQHKRFRIHLPYAMSTVKRATAIHLISQDRTELHYHPIGSWFDGEKVFGEPRWKFFAYYECTQASKQLRLLSKHEAEVLVDLELMHFCRTCQQLRALRKSK